MVEQTTTSQQPAVSGMRLKLVSTRDEIDVRIRGVHLVDRSDRPVKELRRVRLLRSPGGLVEARAARELVDQRVVEHCPVKAEVAEIGTARVV